MSETIHTNFLNSCQSQTFITDLEIPNAETIIDQIKVNKKNSGFWTNILKFCLTLLGSVFRIVNNMQSLTKTDGVASQ